jgi:asparagine synthase (glutamine-hydrolysing)
MSAIVGRVNFNGAPIDTGDFGRAFAALAAYGGDHANIWLEGPVALGHHLLEVTPESRYERQPHAVGSAVIVADARIDNRDELLTRFGFPPNLRPEIPDSHLILRAYHLWGDRCTEHLVGDFAFAIWNKSTQSLLCARDHIGARPLYFSRTVGGFVFATDIRAIEQFRDVDLAIDQSEVGRYLVGKSPSNGTFFQSIFNLQPAQQITVSADGYRQQTHWSPENVPEVRYRSPSDYVEHFRTVLDVAVADRVRTLHRIGAHLSGGLDSSGVAVLAQRELKKRACSLHMVYSWSPPRSDAYPSRAVDERNRIEQVCVQEGLDWHYPDVAVQDFLDYLSRDMALEGTTDVFEELAIMRHAGNAGIRTMLSGWGGDEAATFGGRGYLAYLLKSGRFLRLFGIMRNESGGIRNLSKVIGPLFFRHCVVPLLPDALYDRFDPYYRADREQCFISPQLEKQYPAIRKSREGGWRLVGDPRRMQSALLSSGHLARRMETWAHWSAPHKIVYSYPLTDKRVLELAMGMPRDLLYQKGHWRYPFRAALDDVLPRELAWRRSKADPVNDAKRFDLCLACWKQLSDDAKAGSWDDGDVAWLDRVALDSTLVAVPEKFATDQMKMFLALMPAVRARKLAQSRYAPSP